MNDFLCAVSNEWIKEYHNQTPESVFATILTDAVTNLGAQRSIAYKEKTVLMRKSKLQKPKS